MAARGPNTAIRENAELQKADSRRRLLAGAEQVFRQAGYLTASVDDIARAAGVSRQTFYRHFDSKLAIAIEFFKARREEALPLWCALTEAIAMDLTATKSWMAEFLAFQRRHKPDLRALFEIGVFEPGFLTHASGLVPQIIETLAERLTAFAATSGSTSQAQLLRAEAYLLVYQIIDQSTIAAMGFCVLEEPLLAEALSQSMVGFVRRNTPDKPCRPIPGAGGDQ
jgi:AcrR family transcriptional regulator